jgi:hypothetical protein
MNMKKSLIVLIVGFAILSFVSASWAKELRIPLTSVEPHLQAKGTAYLTGDGLSIHAKGLRPNSVYTVWFVNTKPKMHETGAGGVDVGGIALMASHVKGVADELGIPMWRSGVTILCPATRAR